MTADLYAVPAFRRYVLGSTDTLYHFDELGIVTVASSELAPALARCQTFRTFEDHAAALPAELVPLLRELFDQGALLSLDALLARREVVEPPARITSLVIPTCDRPRLLERALRGYLENDARYGRRTRIVVGDDAPDSQTTREMLAELSRTYDRELQCIDRPARRELAAMLSRASDTAPELLELALLGDRSLGTIGANRNALALATAGELVFSCDDDTTCIAGTAREPAGGLLATDADPQELWFLPDRDAVLREWARTDRDVLAAHEQLLGRSLHALVAAHRDALDLGSNEITRMLARGEGRVVLAHTGLAGESGMYAGGPLLGLGNAPTKHRVVASEAAFRMAETTREILRVSRSQAVSPIGAFCSAAYGIDQRGMLPPFFPVLRDEDGLFAFVLRRIRPDALAGYPGIAVFHDPPDRRSALARERAYRRIRVSDVVQALITTLDERGATAEARLQALGDGLQDIAHPSRFHERVCHAVFQMAAKRCMFLEYVLAESKSEPPFWTAEVARCLAAIRESVLDDEYTTPVDLPDPDDTRLCSLVRDFGRLLSAWPRIVAAARQLAVTRSSSSRR